MSTYRNLPRGMYMKQRPSAYESDGMTVGGNSGWVLSSKPKEYPITSQQRKVRDAAHKCGIKTGISRPNLRKAMIDCVGPIMRGETLSL